MKTYVWGLPTRLFHWLLAIGFLAAFIIGEWDGNMNLHTAFGYMVGALLIFRIVWGFTGPKYSRFKDFALFGSKGKNYPGHNVAASWIMIAIIIGGIVVVASGMMTISRSVAWLSFIPVWEAAEDLHEAAAKITLLLVALHLVGVAIDRIRFGKTGTLGSIVTGKKNLNAESIKITRTQTIFSFIWVILAAAAFISTILWQEIKRHEDHHGHDQHVEQVQE